MTKSNIRRHSGCQECLVSVAKKTMAVHSTWAASNRGGGSEERQFFTALDVEFVR